MTEILTKIPSLLDEIHDNMLDKATKFRDAHIMHPVDYDAFKTAVEGNWALSYWCGSAECESKIKEDTKATIRCLPLEQDDRSGTCISCGKPAEKKAYFAKAY